MMILDRFASCSLAEVKDCIRGRQMWLKQYDTLVKDGILDDVPRVAASLRVVSASNRHDIKTLERYSRLMKKHNAKHVRDLADLPDEKGAKSHDQK